MLVVGLGPGPVSMLTGATIEALQGALAEGAPCFLRTRRHPAASAFDSVPSFDDLYERLDTFDEVYQAVVEQLVAAAAGAGSCVYAVPGSPLVAERTVELLLADPRVQVGIEPALSFLEVAWTRLQVDPLAVGVRIIDGLRFAAGAAGEHGPLLVAQCHSQAVLSDIKLALDTDLTPGPEVVVLQRLGLPDERIVTVAWDDLDRVIDVDHLTSLYIPWLAAPVATELVELAEVTRTLRERCPWDAEQTHASLARYAVEEAYELVEAIDVLDAADGEPGVIDHFADELGDVLFQVVLHACLATERGWFTLADVARAQREKLVRRHPHVYPRDDFDASGVDTAGDVAANWERIKAAEPDRPANGPMGGLPSAAPALVYASAVLKRAGKEGAAASFASSRGSGASRPEATAESVGAALLDLVAWARHGGIDAEVALRQASARLRDAVAAASGSATEHR